MASNLAICYEATQRKYRNAVIGYLRSRFLEAYPTDWQAKLRQPFGKEEWEKNEVNIRERRASGELNVDIKDGFDVLGVNHFYNLFEVNFDLLFPRAPGQPDNERRRQRQAILQWARTVKAFRDPLSHPSEQDFSFEDAFLMIDSARRILEALQLPEAEDVKQLASSLSGFPKPLPEPLQHSLPPRESVVVDFVGREQELNRLADWLRDPDMRRWALAGEGGKGKSAIAYEFGTRVRFRAPAPLDIVLWLSAKKKRFKEGEIVPPSGPDFHDLSSALDKLLSDYGWQDDTAKPLEDRRRKVLELLDEFPALVVVDDIDSLEFSEEDAIEFFTLSAPNTKSKILLTSRRTVFGMGNTTTHVTGLNAEDLRKFIKSRCALFGLDPGIFTAQRIGEIGSVTEASPLYIEDLLRLASVVSLAEAVKAWRGKEGDEARKYALGRELEMLSVEAKETLLAACLSSGAVSFAELEAVTGFGKARLGRMIAELQRLFLVPTPRLIEGEERFDVNVNTRSLAVKLMQETDFYRRVENAVKAVSGRLPYLDRGRTGAVIRQAVFLVKTQEFAKAEETIRVALDKDPNNPDLIGGLGFIYKCWRPPKLTDARQQFARAAQLRSKRLDPYRHWIQLETGEREWTAAARAAEQGLKNIPDHPELLYWGGYARSRLGKELLAGLVLEKSRTELEAACSLLLRAIRVPEDLNSARERQVNSMTYRATVLTFEALAHLAELERVRSPREKPAPGKQKHDYVAKIVEHLSTWVSEHPDDPDAQSERERLEGKFGLEI